METSGNAARKDPAVRSALKEQQTARLALKQKMAEGEIEPEAYSKAYESQPEQIVKRKAQESESVRKRATRQAANSVAMSNAKGGAAAFNGGQS